MASITSTSTRSLTILTENDGVPGSYFENEPEDYTVEQLKRWLKCRGLKQSGKRDELLKRVSDCIYSGNHRTLDVSIDEGKWFAAKVIRELNKVDRSPNNQNNTDVPIIPSAGWCLFQSQDIPSLFNYGHIYYYALESIKTIDYETAQNNEDHGLGHMTDKPLKNARKYVESGFVHDVMDTKSEEHYFARAHVWPSMRTELPHNVLVILSNTSGAIIHASCEPCKVSALGRCSHVVAVLFYLLDHVEKHGSTVSVPCTSQPCSWNKGKKRNKNPQRLSSAEYSTKCKKGEVKLIDFDPRPKNRRLVSANNINTLLRKLSASEDLCMWETQLPMTYTNYKLSSENAQILKKKTKILEKNLTPNALMEIPGTKDQSGSDEWFKQKFLRLTASKCLPVCKIGNLVTKGTSNAAVRAYTFIYSNIWNMDNVSFKSTWTKYGLESEPKAVHKYEQQMKTEVFLTGLWVNPKFPFLGCSPDGLIENGLVEIKSLKIFKQNTIEEVVLGKVSVSKDIIDRQCFAIQDGKCVLKPKHPYYYQVQMQLLVTERHFCDFILYSEEGPVSIERIFRNEATITEILFSLTAFWTRVIAPEFFEMRVPRGLHPFILPEDNALDTSCSYTQDELDIADVLSNSFSVPSTASSNPINNLVVIPWGGETSTGIKLTNTCPLDNWIMIFQAMVKSNYINLAALTETGHIIGTALQLIENNQCADAKVAVLTTQPQAVSNCINLYGNEDDYFIKCLRPYLCTKFTSKCSLDTCPSPNQTSTSFTVNLGYPPELSNHVFLDTLDAWLHPKESQCRRKFDAEPLHHIPHVEDITLDDNGLPHPSWHCSGVRTYSERSFINLKSFIIFSVDLVSRGGMLTLAHVPLSIIIDGKAFSLYGATFWNGGHYIGMFYFNHGWILYDGMKEKLMPNSGLVYSKTIFDEPHGYSLSYLIYCIR